MHLTAEELAAVVQDAVKSALKSSPKEDRLLTVEQVSEILNVTPHYLYHNEEAPVHSQAQRPSAL